MRHLRMLVLALLALLAFGVVVVSTAAAEEKEPAGLLFLPKEEPPVTMEGKGGESKLQTLGGKTPSSFTCTANAFKALALSTDKGNSTTHITLGTVTIDFSGCKSEISGSKVPCSSELTAGVKDPKETILVEADLHFVSLETAGGKLVPGILIIFLKIVTLNCGGLKITMNGTAIGEAEKVSATEDVVEVGLNFKAIPELLKCDKEDKLCKKLLEEFACKKSGSLCVNLSGEEENADKIAKATATIKPMVLWDF